MKKSLIIGLIVTSYLTGCSAYQRQNIPKNDELLEFAKSSCSLVKDYQSSSKTKADIEPNLLQCFEIEKDPIFINALEAIRES